MMSINEERYEQIYRDLDSIKKNYLEDNWTLDQITKVYTMSDTVDIGYRASLYRIFKKEGVYKPRAQKNQKISKTLTGARYKRRQR